MSVKTLRVSLSQLMAAVASRRRSHRAPTAPDLWHRVADVSDSVSIQPSALGRHSSRQCAFCHVNRCENKPPRRAIARRSSPPMCIAGAVSMVPAALDSAPRGGPPRRPHFHLYQSFESRPSLFSRDVTCPPPLPLT